MGNVRYYSVNLVAPITARGETLTSAIERLTSLAYLEVVFASKYTVLPSAADSNMSIRRVKNYSNFSNKVKSRMNK